jgi:nucleotide-binding universal stress UspA family protein
MPKLEHILCSVDFSKFSEWAYRHALSLARRYRAKLLVLHVVELWRHSSVCFASVKGYKQFLHHFLDDGQQKILEFVKNCRVQDIQPHCMVCEGMAPDVILALAETEQIDLIVMGTHGRRGFDRLMVGSVTERVMRKALCPVLTVHASHDSGTSSKEQDPVHLGRILACTDFSENSKRALDEAFFLAAEYSSELVLVHVLENIPHSTAREEAIATATDRLKGLIPLKEHDVGRHKTIVRVGKPYKQIIALAGETQSDLVIMAVRGAGAMDLSVFGSTSHRVIQLGPCPVLVVHV